MVLMDNFIARTLSSMTLGAPTTCDSITMFPLLGPPVVDRDAFYLTLDQALGDGFTEITEIGQQGTVPELRVVNKSAKPVFILDGEELLGAKQNRVVNLSILVPAATKLTIPVSCVEAGRWRARSRAFTAAPRTQYATGRAKRMSQVTASMQMSGARSSDQAEVWADIAA
nr:TIGR02452 family protein [Acidobacteriota bacterium]